MGCRSSRLGHDSSGGLRLWVHRKAVNQLGHGWWRLHFDDIRCKRLIWMGVRVVSAAYFTFLGIYRPHGFVEGGFRNSIRKSIYGLHRKDLRHVNVERLFFPCERRKEPDLIMSSGSVVFVIDQDSSARFSR